MVNRMPRDPRACPGPYLCHDYGDGRYGRDDLQRQPGLLLKHDDDAEQWYAPASARMQKSVEKISCELLTLYQMYKIFQYATVTLSLMLNANSPKALFGEFI